MCSTSLEYQRSVQLTTNPRDTVIVSSNSSPFIWRAGGCSIQFVSKTGGDGKVISVGEVEVYSAQGTKIPANQLNFVFSSDYRDGTEYPASKCNDGDPTTFCHSGITSIQGTYLTISYSCVYIPFRVKVFNRQDWCVRC